MPQAQQQQRQRIGWADHARCMWTELRSDPEQLVIVSAQHELRTFTAALIPGSTLPVTPPMAADAGKVCFLAAGVLTETECEGLLGSCEMQGWHGASLEYDLGSGDLAGESVVNLSLRDSDRCMLHDESLAAGIWDKVRLMIPVDAFKPLRPVRVNSCFRCLRYTDRQAGFAKHVDGRSVVDGQISRVTIQLYLNDGFEGGATRLCHADDGEDAARGVDVVPRRGMALIFDQSILHKGCPVRSGIKYTARTEVMYL